MPFERETLAKNIARRLNVLADQLKTQTRASFTDSNITLEFVMARFFNALLGWNLVDLNAEQADFPAADLGDRGHRIAMLVTNEATARKIAGTKDKAFEHRLGDDFDRLIIFFLLPRKPGMPKKFAQAAGGPEIECWDLADLLKQMKNLPNVKALVAADKVLDEELGTGGGHDPSHALHRYFANLREQFATYENLGLPVPDRDVRDGEQDRPVLIRKLFVEPACTDAHFTPEAFDAVWREKNPARPLLPLLAGEKARVVLLADPGMGKSTVIQYLIATLADEAVPPGAEALRGAVPLPFILRDLVSAMPAEVKEWTWDALVAAFRHWRHRGKGAPLAAPLTADDALFRATLASGRAFFLIDGLDEIGDPQRRTAIRDAIWEGFEKYPEGRWLVTSRVVGYEQAEVHRRFIRDDREPDEKGRPTIFLTKIVDGRMERHNGFEKATLLHLTPLDDPQQRAFAGNWFCPRLGEAAGTQRAEDFINAVHRHAHTRVIGRVPNLLYLLALLYRHKAHLPNGRALVYAAISDAYLGAIDINKRLPDSLVVAWKPEEKEELLSIVAMRMQEQRAILPKDLLARSGKTRAAHAQRQVLLDPHNPGALFVAIAAMRMQELRGAQEEEAKTEILVTRAELEEWLGPRFGGAQDAAACAELHRFLDHIANRTGLLLPLGEGVFGFAHLSFQEYYAACHLERDFRRILNDKAQGTADGFFGAPAVPAKEDEEKMFAAMAALPVWHEPLLFLVEKLRHSPPDTLTILRWTFPQLATEPKKGKQWMPITAARLLAGISIDQEVTLDDTQRAKIWSSLWKAHIAAFSGNWNIARSLIVAGSVYRTPALEAAAALRPERIHLTGCTGVNHLHPLHALASLRDLSLSGCTGVSDLHPLSALASLQGLDLAGCTEVRDLGPLRMLASLGWGWLDLRFCTSVSDLQPLFALASLQELWLDGCTGVSQEGVAVLRAARPGLTIHGP